MEMGLSPMKVLIVDDHSYNRQLLQFVLEDNGYTCAMASDGAEALAAVQVDQDIDVVLMDVNMPVMDGYEATRQIKKVVAGRLLPIIFVTALDDDKTLVDCLTVGGDDFVPKPINETILVAKLEAHWRTIDYHRQLEKINAELSYHRRLMDREHSIVEHVFRNGMRRVDSRCDNVHYHVSPMSMFNGDLLLIAPGGKGGIYVLLGDFTGHGLSAAIGCLPVSDIFYAMTSKQASVGEIAREINLRLQDLLPSNMFFCAAVIELNINGDRITVWAGGMNDLLLIGPEGGISKRILSQHMPLGILGDDEFEVGVEIINPVQGSVLVAYTDGVIESQCPSGELYGEERLAALLTEKHDSYTKLIAAEVLDFQSGEKQSDDIAIVEICCEPIRHDGVVDTAQLDVFARESELAKAILAPFRFTWSLDVKALQRDNVIVQIAAVVGSISAMRPHSDVIYMLLSEFYSNSLEHGLLGLDSSLKNSSDGFEVYYENRHQYLQELTQGHIDITLEVKSGDPDHLWLSVVDSGSGFDYECVDNNADNDDEYAFGRGINLIQSLVESYEYSQGGRCLTISYLL